MSELRHLHVPRARRTVCVRVRVGSGLGLGLGVLRTLSSPLSELIALAVFAVLIVFTVLSMYLELAAE